MGLGQQRQRGAACGSTVPRREGRKESIGGSDGSSGPAAAVLWACCGRRPPLCSAVQRCTLATLNGVEPPLPSPGSVLLLPASDEKGEKSTAVYFSFIW
jgi:hypothetical protein